jgi:1,4-dihydroxy-2-naphthoyl-CoA hydrolase
MRVEDANGLIEGRLPGLLGMEFTHVERGRMRARLEIRPDSVAPNGYLHAAAVGALADTACVIGCVAALPDGASSFTTLELKANYVATAREGALACEAELVHGGRTTQVWDARVVREVDGRLVALFRCTQLLIYE